ncbi:MAG: PD-(D/E)XK nuclease family protein [Cyanobacteria bacterium P01_G01_bin.49]
MNNLDVVRNNKLLIRLSQSQLNILETCPPQFQRLYLEQLGSPMSPDIQENLAWGSQFHQLMQQRELGLPLESILGENPELQQTINTLVDLVYQQHELTNDCWREAEHCRTLEFQGYLLTAIYDLLILDKNQAQILDWKTYLQPKDPKKLQDNWQTRLYLYLLAETSDYLPEQISMTYWFVKIPRQPQYSTITYDKKLHHKNHQDLSELLAQLENYLQDYHDKDLDFPHVNNCQEYCPYASFLAQADQSLNTEETRDNLLSMIDEIEEISL